MGENKAWQQLMEDGEESNLKKEKKIGLKQNHFILTLVKKIAL
jgi:hypothetical protein